MNILIIFALINVLFLLLGFYFGRHTAEKTLPRVALPFKKPVFEEDDPYIEAQKDPEPDRKPTL